MIDRVVQVASSGDDASRSKVWYPWMTLGGEVNLRLLNRIRQGMVAYVKKHPGSRTGDVRYCLVAVYLMSAVSTQAL